MGKYVERRSPCRQYDLLCTEHKPIDLRHRNDLWEVS